MPEKVIVPPFNKQDIIDIIKEAIVNGTITTQHQAIDKTKTYTLKLAAGDIVLVEDQD